jgi:hypothetical protein
VGGRTCFEFLPARSRNYHVCRASNPLLLPLAFGEAYRSMCAAYEANERIAGGAGRRFHPRDTLLLHPLH